MKTRIAIFGSALALASMMGLSSARADVYGFESTGADYFGRVYYTTGAFTSLGNSGLLLSGLGAYGGKVYGGAEGGAGFYQVNTGNGALTLLGNSSASYEDTGSTTSGVYEFGRNSNLYKINTATGASTLIGNTGIAIDGTIGMSSSGSKLFISSNASLYLVNTTTGASTLVGTTTGAVFGAMANVGGVYYGGDDSSYPTSLPLVSFDPLTAAITPVSTQTAAYGDFWGLTPGVPEPSTWALMLLGFGGLGLAGYRRATAAA